MHTSCTGTDQNNICINYTRTPGYSTGRDIILTNRIQIIKINQYQLNHE